jgi:hypothetical protein
MKLLKTGVTIPVPPFKVRFEDEEIEISFSIHFKRISQSERKRRLKKLMKSMKGASKLAEEISAQESIEQGLRDDPNADPETLLAAVQAGEVLAADVEGKLDDLDGNLDKDLHDDILGWENLTDVDGSAVEYSKREKEELLDSPPFIEAIKQVWSEADGGVPKEIIAEADSKN